MTHGYSGRMQPHSIDLTQTMRSKQLFSFLYDNVILITYLDNVDVTK